MIQSFMCTTINNQLMQLNCMGLNGEKKNRGLTFRTTCTKSLEFWGLRPCICRVHASREDAWATISTVFPVRGYRAYCSTITEQQMGSGAMGLSTPQADLSTVALQDPKTAREVGNS